MDRRAFLASAAGAIAVSSVLPGQGLAAESSGDAQFHSLLDTLFMARIADDPQAATALGYDVGPRAGLRRRLTNVSSAALADRRARAQASFQAFQAVSRGALSNANLLRYDIVSYFLRQDSQNASQFQFGDLAGFPYAVSQLNGSYITVPGLLVDDHPIKAPDDAESYLDRLRAFAGVLAGETERLQSEAGRGYAPPGFILDMVTSQLQALQAKPATSHVLIRALKERLGAAHIADNFTDRAIQIMERTVIPALHSQEALIARLRASASVDAGVWRLPDGEAYYAQALSAMTTTRLGAEQLHRLGKDKVTEINAKLDKLLSKQGFILGSVSSRLQLLAADPGQLYPDTEDGRADLIADLNAEIAKVTAQLDSVFRTKPRSGVFARRRSRTDGEGGPVAAYESGPTISQPSAMVVSLNDLHRLPRYALKTLCHHESVPGHHMQHGLAREAPELPALMQFYGSAGYSEGWALYAEQLAQEMGLYEGDPWGEIGFLQDQLLRAGRLVCDTGIHHHRWSRQEAVDYMVATTGSARSQMEAEVSRYCACPGQACGYMVGQISWLSVRQDARTRLGTRFDLREFHEVLLEGSMPLDQLRISVEQWTKTVLATPG